MELYLGECEMVGWGVWWGAGPSPVQSGTLSWCRFWMGHFLFRRPKARWEAWSIIIIIVFIIITFSSSSSPGRCPVSLSLRASGGSG